MIRELAKLGIVIVIISSASPCHSMLSSATLALFGHTFLTLFEGMLGEVGFFDEFLGDGYSEYEEVATAAMFIAYWW